MIERYARWVIRWRYLIILSTIVFTYLLATQGMKRLEFSADYRVFFSKENVHLAAFEELQNMYTKNDNVLFILAPNDNHVFTPKTLDAVEWLTNEAWQIPFSIRVDSISNFQHTHAEEDELIVEDLVTDGKNLSEEEIAKIQAVALQEPQLLHRLISPESHVTGVNVTIQLPGEKPGEEVPKVVEFSKDLVKTFEARYPHIKVYMTGMVVMNNNFPMAAEQDIETLVPIMYLVMIIVLGLLLRGIVGTLGTLLVTFFSVVCAMGMTGFLGIVLSPPTATAPTIILTLAIADSVHLLVTMLHEMRANGREKWDAIVESLRINFQPVFLTSLTTLIGFLSLNFGEVPPFRHLGNIVSMGVAFAFLFSIFFLPAFVAAMPLKVGSTKEDNVQMMDKLGNFVVKRYKALLWSLSFITVILIAFIAKNELNDVFVEYFDETYDFRVATDFATDNLTGLYYIDYSLSSGESNGVSEPKFLHTVEAFANWYRQQPEVMHVNTITDTFKRLNKNMHADNEDYYRLPEDRELAAQYLLLYEMSLPYGLDLNNQVNIDKSATRFTVTTQTLSSNDLLALEERAQQWLKEYGLPSMITPGSGTSIMFSHIGHTNIRAMLTGASVALVLVSLILIVALKSAKYGFLSLAPNILPAAMGFGVWGLFVGQVGMALSVVAGMTLGIVVDDTIHFISKYLRARREKGFDSIEAVRYAFHSVGTALWITTVVLIVGFSILAMSHFQINAGMGLLTAITIALALVLDFLLLPPLLIVIGKKKATSTQ